MPNIADVMLNKRLDELAELERTLDNRGGSEMPTEYVTSLTATHDRLRVLCLRGLARCYPDLTPDQLDERLMVCTRINR